MTDAAPIPSLDRACHANLVALPPELMERIAQALPPEELLPLRLVCREAADKVNRTFVGVHFTDRGFLLCSKASLQTAVKIVSHAEFGRALRTLTFYVNCMKRNYTRNGEKILLQFDGSGHQIGELAARRTGERRAQAFEAREDMRDQGDDISLLTTLFSHLRRRAVDVKIFLRSGRDRNHGQRSPVGWTTFNFMTDTDFNLPEPTDSYKTFAVLEALSLSAYQPTGLQVGDDSWSTSFGDFDPDRCLLKRLTSLELHYWAVIDSPKGEDLDEYSTKFRDLLSEAQCLEELTLRAEWREWRMSSIQD